MRRAAIHNPYWDSLGGGERYSAALVELLLHHGWQVDIWWPQNLTRPVERRFGLDIHGANFTPPTSSAKYNLLFWVSDGSLPISWAGKTVIHFQFPFRGVGGRRLVNFIKSRFYQFVVNSFFTKSFIDREFAVNSRVVYPPVETAQFKPTPKTDTLLYVGRFSHLTQIKNHRFLVNTFRKLSPQLPGWKLILAGGVGIGTQRAKLERLQKSVQGGPIEIITNPTLTDLKKLYSQAKIYWSASGYGVDEDQEPLKVEHFGITVVEAMAAGCVPLVANLGGHKEIVSHGQDGLLWSTPRQLASLTRRLVKDESWLTALARAARQKSRMFAVGRFNAAFIKLLNL